MKILIASKSPYKIEGISNAFREFFPEKEVIVESIKASSGVDRQPYNDDVFKGAKNRLNNAKETGIEYDYVIGCESGLINQFQRWFNVQIIVIEDINNHQVWGTSPGFEIPDKYVSQVLSTSLKEVFDKVLGSNGGISFLTKEKSSRKKLIEDATIMALSRFNWTT